MHREEVADIAFRVPHKAAPSEKTQGEEVTGCPHYMPCGVYFSKERDWDSCLCAPALDLLSHMDAEGGTVPSLFCFPLLTHMKW